MANTNTTNADYIFQLGFGYWKSCILFTAVEFDLFTRIGKGKVTARGISKSIHANERATEMLLNALVSLKLLTRQKNHYKNSLVSNLHLIKGKPLYLGDAVHHAHNIMDNWTMLRETIETGNAVSLKDLPEEVDPHDARDFITAMHNIASVKADELCSILDLRGVNKFMDLAGGPGTYAIAFAKANPQLRAVVFDLEHVTKLTREFIKASRMEEQVSVRAGNCLEDSFGMNEYDAILVSNILHIYNPANNVKILRKCRDALREGGRVMIHEFVLDETKTRPQFAALFSLNMLIGTQEGASYSESEYRKWLRDAGFKQTRKIDLKSGSAVFIGKK